MSRRLSASLKVKVIDRSPRIILLRIHPSLPKEWRNCWKHFRTDQGLLERVIAGHDTHIHVRFLFEPSFYFAANQRRLKRLLIIKIHDYFAIYLLERERK